MLELTSNAARAIDRLLSDGRVPDGAGVRIESGGPSHSDNGADAEGGTLRIVIAPEPPRGDEVIEQQGTRVFIDPDVSPFLDDKLLDIAKRGATVQFVLAEQQ